MLRDDGNIDVINTDIKDGRPKMAKGRGYDTDKLIWVKHYYGSDLWKQDFADDSSSLLPQDLKCGVLSEDAAWNLLEDVRDLKERMREMVADM